MKEDQIKILKVIEYDFSMIQNQINPIVHYNLNNQLNILPMLGEDCHSQNNQLFEVFFHEDCPFSGGLLLQKEQIHLDSKLNHEYAEKKQKGTFNNSLWTYNENIRYCEFVKKNIDLFQSGKKNRQLCKINKQISDFVKTRSTDQCRSHHQKMLKFHGSAKGIVQHLSFLRSTIENGQQVPVRTRRRRNQVNVQQIVIPLPQMLVSNKEAIWEDVLELN